VAQGLDLGGQNAQVLCPEGQGRGVPAKTPAKNPAATPKKQDDKAAAAKTGVSKAAGSIKPGDTKADKEADAQTAPAGKKSMLEKAALASGKTESLNANSAAVSAAHKSKPGSAFDGDNELF